MAIFTFLDMATATATTSGQCYKTFLFIIYLISFEAKVFVRLSCKSLPGTNNLTKYENL